MKTAQVAVLLLVAACAVNAQEQNAGTNTTTNAAAAFTDTSAAQTKLMVVPGTDDAAPVNPASASNSADAAAEAAPSPLPAPAPAAHPKIIFGERDDYRWQLGVGFEYFRFNSSQFDANLIGLDTSLTYFTNGWFGVEGNVSTGFSTGTFSGDHVKIVGYMGGIHIGSRRAKWEPWFHGLVGGSHLGPQTALGGRNGVMSLVGGGVDYRIHARLSLRAEGDWAHTAFFSQSQNNFQATGGAVLHF